MVCRATLVFRDTSPGVAWDLMTSDTQKVNLCQLCVHLCPLLSVVMSHYLTSYVSEEEQQSHSSVGKTTTN